jgi:hypothetical protein
MFKNVGKSEFRICHEGAIQEHALLMSDAVSAVEW